tara:strand:- start:26 stop:400 length:375 start_codon:yes stop_codon:yes gene_type:complete
MNSLSAELIDKIDDIKEKITTQEYVTLCNIANKIHKKIKTISNNNIEENRINITFHFLVGRTYNVTIMNNFTLSYFWQILSVFHINERDTEILYNGSILRCNYEKIIDKFGDINELDLHVVRKL